MDAARIEHAVDAGRNQDDEGQQQIDDFAIAFLFMLDARRVLILLRDYEVLIALADTLGHRTIVTARPDDEDHEQQRQPGIEIERDCLQEQREPVDVAALRQRGADSSGPARYWGDDADWCRRRIDDIREFRARNLELIRHRTHDRTNGQTVEIIVDEDDQSQKRRDQRGTALAADRTRSPLTIGARRAAARDGCDQDAEDDEEHEDIDVAADLIGHDGKHRQDRLDDVAPREEHRTRKDADDQGHVYFFCPERQRNRNQWRQYGPDGFCHEHNLLSVILVHLQHYNALLVIFHVYYCITFFA